MSAQQKTIFKFNIDVKENGEKNFDHALSLSTNIGNSTRLFFPGFPKVISAAAGASDSLRSHLDVKSAFRASRWGWFGYR